MDHTERRNATVAVHTSLSGDHLFRTRFRKPYAHILMTIMAKRSKKKGKAISATGREGP
jgi:hypothetical protein